jgi:hypothetical protein
LRYCFDFKIKGKYTAYTSGELHIRSVDENDLHKTYRCKARNRLTTQMTMSPNGARLILSGILLKLKFQTNNV